MHAKRFALLILDGWGIGPDPQASALALASTPAMDSYWAENPHTTLTTFGEAVGLPEGQMGNSEVGHLNLGAGRVVYQDLAKINKALREGSLAQNPVWLELLQKAKASGRPLQLMGLVSEGGVHSHLQQLIGLCAQSQILGELPVQVHAFLDGRDTDPQSGYASLQTFLSATAQLPVSLGSVIGRYYAMDRDKRWERTALAYQLLCAGEGQIEADLPQAVKNYYAQGITDEFMRPLRSPNMLPLQAEDVLLCFNFRTDRCRQISQVLSQGEVEGMKPLGLHYYTLTRYDERYQGVGVLFEKDNLSQTLGEVLAEAGKTQLRLAETEKYPHVTFFFSGGREEAFEGETRLIVPSPKVATYDLQPEMSAPEVTERLLNHLETEGLPDFICLNYANADMVGHTGSMSAAIKAAETVDNCLSRLVPELLSRDYSILILADHGNSDCMHNPDGSPNTAHTTNPVPCILLGLGQEVKLREGGKLGDVAPTILQALGLPIPSLMDGQSLLV